MPPASSNLLEINQAKARIKAAKAASISCKRALLLAIAPKRVEYRIAKCTTPPFLQFPIWGLSECRVRAIFVGQ